MTWLVKINKTRASSRIFRLVEVERESSLHALVRYFQPVTFARKKHVYVGTATVRCQKNDVTGDIIVLTESLQMITTWVYSMDATMNMTDDLKKMYVDDANVQTTHKENAVSRINQAAFESGIDPMDPVTHAT